MDKVNKIIWGLVFIFVGLIIGTNSLNLTNIDLFFNGWWTLFIIVPSFIGLFNRKGEFTGNFIGLIIGFALLLMTRDLISFETVASLIIPFIFIVIGITIIFNNTIKNKINEKLNEVNKDGLEKIVATFAEQKINKDDEKFSGAELDAVFGSIILDLTRANLDKEVVIKTSNIFAGTKILVPNNVNIKIKSTPIFGGVTNKVDNKKDNKKTIYIESFNLFGGLEIK